MTADQLPVASGPEAFVEACARAMPEVYGYLLARCGSPWIAEDLTSETFVIAVSATKRRMVDELTVPWLIVVARRRLIDHWRRAALETRRLGELAAGEDEDAAADPEWEEPIDVVRCRCALHRLGPHHRAALTLRYLDGLSVSDVADELGRGYDATEALLHRARRALRRAYEEEQTHA